jgi:ornithine cyclodeaminase/alanine dehydrogenase-like protein (mu-crystallin family)
MPRPSDVTLFKSVGTAVQVGQWFISPLSYIQDIATAHAILQRAKAEQVGTIAEL